MRLVSLEMVNSVSGSTIEKSTINIGRHLFMLDIIHSVNFLIESSENVKLDHKTEMKCEMDLFDSIQFEKIDFNCEMG